MEADVIIIGAGLAGLAAAEGLAAAGRTVHVLEARDRIGGRVWSVPTEAGLPAELGAEWFDSKGDLRTLLTEHGRTMREAGGRFLQRTEVGWRSFNQEDATDDPLERIRGLDGPDRALTEALRTTRKGEAVSREERYLLQYVQGFHAADPDRLSMHWLLRTEEDQSAGASQVRCLEGADATATLFRSRLGPLCSIHLRTIVHTVRWRAGHVEVQARGPEGEQVFTAPRVLITLPLAVLQASGEEREGSVRFDPPLVEKREALSKLAMGEVAKVVLVFREAFWMQDPSLKHALFLQDPRQLFATWWTTGPEEAPLLNAWAGGPLARPLTGLSEEDLREEAVRSLAGVLQVPRSIIGEQLTGFFTHAWSRDPFARGAYSYVMAGGLHAPAELGLPLARTLYFAGEATCGDGYNATMEGAVRTGRRAATELFDP